MEAPIVWHAARLHLRVSVNLVYDVQDTSPHNYNGCNHNYEQHFFIEID